MLGGNPQGDRFGFRYWKNPGVFAKKDAAGILRGIWRSVTWATFAIAGPDKFCSALV
jgi:amino acid transporter